MKKKDFSIPVSSYCYHYLDQLNFGNVSIKFTEINSSDSYVIVYCNYRKIKFNISYYKGPILAIPVNEDLIEGINKI